MIYSLTGTAHRLQYPQVSITANGVGYLLSLPATAFESVMEGREVTLFTYTYIREDRMDLYGFFTEADRAFFASLINMEGVGPKLGLELCSIPRQILTTAVATEDHRPLTDVKGVGKKTAEKLLVELKSLFERHPEWFALLPTEDGKEGHASLDRDAVAALVSLGYDQSTVMQALKKIPKDITKTEERVAAVLRSL